MQMAMEVVESPLEKGDGIDEVNKKGYGVSVVDANGDGSSGIATAKGDGVDDVDEKGNGIGGNDATNAIAICVVIDANGNDIDGIGDEKLVELAKRREMALARERDGVGVDEKKGDGNGGDINKKGNSYNEKGLVKKRVQVGTYQY